MMNPKFMLLPAAVFAIGLLSACELDDAVCTSNADCADGEECTAIDSETGEGTCTVVDVGTGCTADTDCTGDEVCVAEVCVDPTVEATFDYVAVISETTNSDDIDDTNTPGPDFDAIELIAGGQSTFASTVEAFNQGAGGNNDGNVNSQVENLLRTNDAIPTGGGNCDLGEGDGFWSAGDTSGFAVVSFGNNSLADGDTIRVWELDDLICTNVSTTRADAYGVYMGDSDVNVTAISNPSDISGSSWLLLGSANGSGGLEEFTVAF